MLNTVTTPAIRRPAPLWPIQLPAPEGSNLHAALEQRRTIREIAPTPLPARLLSQLLWAAWGVNRKNGPFGQPGRTAASASNSQEIDLYVALPEAAYLYDAAEHRLMPVATGDLRQQAMTPGQRHLGGPAPVQLIYVADIHRLANTAGFQEPGLQDPEVQKAYYYVDTGLIAGNVYLFAAAQGLAAWFHNCDRAALAEGLQLRRRQRVLFAQSVGYPEAA
ncbi:MAG TPA: nitroreductase family protein [Candidatus Cybelea sp.]|nr:nitroreductase family protein [Candidatus Cybelea sp.]